MEQTSKTASNGSRIQGPEGNSVLGVILARD